MSTMAVSSGVAARSTLNPNAPLYIPAAFQQVEDFSPEWWELVKTTTWFRDYWLQQHGEQETFDGDEEEDAAILLPDFFDLGLANVLDVTEAEAAVFPACDQIAGVLAADLQKEKKLMLGLGNMSLSLVSEAVAVIKSLNSKSPKNGRVGPVVEPAKYREKPLQCVSRKCSPRCIIHQPR